MYMQYNNINIFTLKKRSNTFKKFKINSLINIKMKNNSIFFENKS